MRKPSLAQRAAHQHRQRAVTGQEAGHQQHRLARRGAGARARRTASRAGRARSAGSAPGVARPLGERRCPRAAPRARCGRAKPCGRRKDAERVRMSPDGYGGRRTSGTGTYRSPTGVGSRQPRPVDCGSMAPGHPNRRRAPSPVSEELFAPVGPGVELCYQTFGDPDRRAAAAGDGSRRPDELVGPRVLRAAGRSAASTSIRYDNRDTGRSTKIGGRVPALDAGAGLRRAPGPAAVHARRHGRRRVRAARPPRPRRPRTSWASRWAG